jgi:hypothetical protein
LAGLKHWFVGLNSKSLSIAAGRLADFRFGGREENRGSAKDGGDRRLKPKKNLGFWASVPLYGVTPEGDGKLELLKRITKPELCTQGKLALPSETYDARAL